MLLLGMALTEGGSFEDEGQLGNEGLLEGENDPLVTLLKEADVSVEYPEAPLYLTRSKFRSRLFQKLDSLIKPQGGQGETSKPTPTKNPSGKT